MELQSLSIVVPNKKCMNDCRFCVSKMHCDAYPNCMDPADPMFDLGMADYLKRLEFARHNGCNTVMLTGTSEPQQNKTFLTFFGMFQKLMRDPFQWVEMQTTGAGLDRDFLRFLRNHVGVSLVSLSVSSLDDQENALIIRCPPTKAPNLAYLAGNIRDYGFSLRMSLNLTSYFDRFADDPAELFDRLKSVYGADQATLRVLYASGTGTPQDDWIAKHAAAPETVRALENYVLANGRLLGTLPYGARKYSVHGMSVVTDADCMAKDDDKKVLPGEHYKYLILQPNAKLYSQWDDPASLIF